MSSAEKTTVDVGMANGGDDPTLVNKASKKSMSVKHLILATGVAAIIACAVGIPVARHKRSANKAKSTELPWTGSSFASSLDYFGPDITKGYDSQAELDSDMQSASKLLLNQVLKRNLGVPGYEGVGYGQSNPYASNSGQQQETTAESDSTRVSSDLTDYGTNNQEDGVEEGDLVASSNNLTFAAYGDYIVAFNPRTGEDIIEFRLPFNKTLGDWYGGGPAETTIADGDMRMMIRMPSIRSLVVHEESKRLLVISDGLAPQKIADAASSSSSSDATLPILFEWYGTHIRLYDTDTLIAGDTEPLTTYDINGNFNAVRMINGVAHVMTSTGVDMNSYLVAPFERSNKEFADMTDDEYFATVQTKAEQAVPMFTEKLMSEITLPSGIVPKLAKISLFANEASSDGLEDLTMPASPMNMYSQITSFEMTADTIDASASGTFTPDYWARFYASTNAIIVATQGSKTVEILTRSDGKEKRTSIEQTYFTSFSIDGGTTAPHSVGKVDGYLLNEYAIDVLNDVLRVAVTIWKNTYVYDPSWQIDDNVIVIQEGEDRSLRGLQSNSETAVPDDDWMIPSEDLTENYVVVLQMPGPDVEQPGEMELIGRVQIGKPDETITAVRFFDNIGYAVTFEQTDPFYVLDLANGPSVLGELEISGFSSYLHSINSDHTLILAIGQETDDDGMILGLQLTVFDMSTPSSPTVLHRHQIETSENVDSYTDAQWDFKAARYAGGHLILPMDMYPMYANMTDTQSFHGFVAYSADENGIVEECRINHDLGTTTTGCYCSGGLPRRSMIFDGNVVTMQSSAVVSTNMNSCQQLWTTTIDAGNNDGDECCGVW